MAPSGLIRLGCRNCRYNVVQSFLALAGVHLPPQPHQRLPAYSQSQRRLLSQSHSRGQDSPFESLSRKNEGSQDTDEGSIDADQSSAPKERQTDSPSSLPWYLQASSTTSTPLHSSISDRQNLPDLPDDAPPLLPALTNYLFETAGLDDLSVIDLRHLDPPPALGANLIMVLGTARSIKHLNVSADQFCRWLRSEHKLRPYADGLLGRNELKIRLRRRAKRAKLAASAGRQVDDTNRDDGLTTGWVCVNVGTVSGTDGEQNSEIEIQEEGGGFIGFGARDKAPRVVVQMFTEEKRAELDLEGLWDHRQARRVAKEEKHADEIESEIVQDIGKAFDESSNAYQEMNPPPSELRTPIS